MAENILQQFGTQHFSHSFKPLSDLVEYQSYTAYGIIKNQKITGFSYIVWSIDFSSTYSPLKHIIIGIADKEYQHNSQLDSRVPNIKYGVDFRCRGGKIENTHLLPDTENFLLVSRDSHNRITFIGEHTEGERDGFGVEISYTDDKYAILYGVWEAGVLRYKYENSEWKEV